MKNFFKRILPPNPAKIFMQGTRNFLGFASISLRQRAQAKKMVEAMGEGLYGCEKGISEAE